MAATVASPPTAPAESDPDGALAAGGGSDASGGGEADEGCSAAWRTLLELYAALDTYDEHLLAPRWPDEPSCRLGLGSLPSLPLSGRPRS